MYVDLRGNASVVSEKSKGEIRQSTPVLAEQHKTLSASSLSTSNNCNLLEKIVYIDLVVIVGMYGKLIATSANGMTEAELVAENKLLRHFLRDLNDILNQQVGKIKVEEDHDNRKVEFKNKSPEEQMRTIVKEIANNEKIMAYNKEENRKTEAKLNRIKDPLYLLNIQQEIETVQAKVDEMKRDNRKLMHSNGNIGKDLDMIENVKGVPQALEETREKQVEIKKLTKKLEGLIQKNLDMDQEKEQKLDKKESLVTEIKKLQREEEAFNSEASITRASRLKYMLLMAEETYKSLSKRYRMKKINVERELEQMIVENHKGKEHIERLDDIIKEQNAMLKGMISSERGKYSKPAQEVLDKMRLSIEYDESKQKWGSSNYLDDDKLEALKVVPNRPVKSKSIERGGGRIKRDLFDLQDDRRVHQSFSKHKPAIKRELIGAKASIWKETVVGDRARMEEILNMSPSRKYQHEDPVYMKPIGNKKSYGFVASAKNSEEGDVRGTPMFNGGAKVKPLGQSGSVKQLGTKGVSVPSPNESRLKPRGKEWHGINEENGLDNSWGDSSARKKQQQSKGNILDNSHSKGGRESEVETAKPIVKTKKRSQLEQIVMDDIKKGTAKFKSVEDDDSIVKGNQGVKKPEQPDNSQKVEKVQKRGNTTKGSDVTKVKIFDKIRD